ncbi:MAG: TlpA family protein disulfide reductase [Bacteroidia bacterium]|nr:TlpA family protein disulfide reductase [Bacteroidia bacterium]
MRLRIFLFLMTMPAYLSAGTILRDGQWRGLLSLNDTTMLPFTFMVANDTLVLSNNTEKITVTEIETLGDSVFIKMPFFDSEFRMEKTDFGAKGVFINHGRKSNAVIPATFEFGITYRFSDKPEKPVENITGRWQIHFDGEEPQTSMGIADLKQAGARITGTILTPTGDHRFLDGELNGDRLWLSAFDGSHVFLHTAVIRGDSMLQGEFFSGTHWHDTWTGWKNDSATLPDPESLSFFKPSFNKLEFRFSDENGNWISFPDIKFNNKVVIIQLMGSWCPNCLDETRFLTSINAQYHDRGVEIVALDYERISDTMEIRKNMIRFKKQLGINYPVLYAGNSDRSAREKSLPMLSAIVALPTTIILDKKGTVREIYTGFSGPATGAEYEAYTDRFRGFLDRLLTE